MSREPMGVVIPPDPGDKGACPHCGAAGKPWVAMGDDWWICTRRAEAWMDDDGSGASQEPQAPSSAPDTPQPVSQGADGSEALRATLEPILDTLYANGQPLIDYIWPLIEADRLAYGDRREAAGAERAPVPHDVMTYLAAEAAGGDRIAEFLYAKYHPRPPLTARADEIRRTQT